MRAHLALGTQSSLHQGQILLARAWSHKSVQDPHEACTQMLARCSSLSGRPALYSNILYPEPFCSVRSLTETRAPSLGAKT